MPPREIEIRFDGAVAIVDAAHANIVAPLLTSRVHAFNGKGGIVSGRRDEEVLGRVAGGEFRFPAKLFAVVGSGLAASGITVKLWDLNLGVCKPDQDTLMTFPEP